MHGESPIKRRESRKIWVGNVPVGGDAPIAVQSMTNTDTADVDSTVKQVAALARAGSEMVRITVDRDEAAAAVVVGPDGTVDAPSGVPVPKRSRAGSSDTSRRATARTLRGTSSSRAPRFT